MTTTTITMTGHDAIDYAERHGLDLAKHADPTEGARAGLSVGAAREIAREDPSLVYVEVEAQIETMPAECLRCGRSGEREMVIGDTEYDSQRAVDACPRCSSHDARAE